MLLQTNSYIVPKDKRAEHARLLRRFRAALAKLGCDSFEVYEQVGSNWSTGEPTGRYVQIMRFRDRRHQLAVQAAERSDSAAQAIIAEFCQLINFPYQQQQGLFAVGFYNSVLPVAPSRPQHGESAAGAAAGAAAGFAEAEAEGATEGHHAEAPRPDAAEALDPGDVAPEGEADEAVAEHARDAEEAPAGEVEELAATTDAEEPPAEHEASAENGEALADQPEEITPDEAAASADYAAVDDALTAQDELSAEEALTAEDELSAGEALAAEDAGDELGALLDSHLHAHDRDDSPNGPAHPLDAGETAAGQSPEGLDALDLSDLGLPDEPAADPHPAPDHAAR